jgi:hypothetical protein
MLTKKDKFKRKFRVYVEECGETPSYTGRAICALASGSYCKLEEISSEFFQKRS